MSSSSTSFAAAGKIRNMINNTIVMWNVMWSQQLRVVVVVWTSFVNHLWDCKILNSAFQVVPKAQLKALWFGRFQHDTKKENLKLTSFIHRFGLER
jgi:hypothetical protein